MNASAKDKNLLKKGYLFARSFLLKIRGAIHPAENTFFFILVVLIGCCGGIAAIIFRSLSALIMRLYSGSFEYSLLDIAVKSPIYLKIAIPAAGAFIAGLIIYIGLHGKKGEGISEIMEAVSLKGTPLKVKNVFFKSLSSLMLISTGGSVGREGPIIQIGASLSSKIGEFFGVPRDKFRILIGCGVAAGMAAAYNAPIGASLFVMEIIIGNFAMEIFGPVVLSSLIATLISRATLGAGPLYAIPHLTMSNAWELVAYAFLGVLCAFAARLFTISIPFLEKIFKLFPIPFYLKTTLGGVIIGSMAFWFPQVWGNGYEGISKILNGEFALTLMALLFLMKIIATSVTVGSGGSGGTFTPTLFIGACLGGVFGHAMNNMVPEISGPVGGYALAGMGGAIAGTTHAPIMAIFIIFEMTQEYDMILPLILTCILGALVSKALKKDSFYTEKLEQRGIHLDLEMEEAALKSVLVEDIMKTNISLIKQDTPLEEVMKSFLSTRSNYLYVGDSSGNFIGVIDLHDIKEMLSEKGPSELVIAWDLIKDVPTITPREPIAETMEKFWFQEMGHLPVIEGHGSKKFLGIVTRRDIIGAFDREVLKRKMLLSRVLRTNNIEDVARYLDLPEELSIKEVPLPSPCSGNSLKDIDMYKRFHLNVLGMKRIYPDGREEKFQPSPDEILKEGDILIILGKPEDIKRFSNME